MHRNNEMSSVTQSNAPLRTAPSQPVPAPQVPEIHEALDMLDGRISDLGSRLDALANMLVPVMRDEDTVSPDNATKVRNTSIGNRIQSQADLVRIIEWRTGELINRLEI